MTYIVNSIDSDSIANAVFDCTDIDDISVSDNTFTVDAKLTETQFASIAAQLGT